MKQVHVTIDQMGNPTIEGKGFTGKECDAATKAIEDHLRATGTAVTKEYKPEANMGGGGTTQQQTARW